jgi:A/G-specific adenine glycosylase
MLQQTQVDRVVPFFLRWIERFPTLRSLADADEAEVLKLWEGLGYYSRCRNLLRAARAIDTTLGGRIPEDSGSLRSLPGIGPYTAGAISSIAFNRSATAVDANARRVASRIRGREFRNDREVSDFLADFIPDGDARSFNQAIMDLGALVCTPVRPSCEICPVAATCKGRANARTPKRAAVARKKRTTENAVAAIVLDDDRVLLRRRPDSGLWAGMTEFPWEPLGADDTPDSAALRIASSYCPDPTVIGRIGPVSHAFTTHRIRLTGVLLRREHGKSNEISPSGSGVWIPLAELRNETLPAGAGKLRDILAEKDFSRVYDTRIPIAQKEGDSREPDPGNNPEQTQYPEVPVRTASARTSRRNPRCGPLGAERP